MKKYNNWIPVALSLFLIIGLTLQDGETSKQLTENTQAIISTVTNVTSGAQWWDNYILMRKLGHLVEYTPLGSGTYFIFKKRKILKTFSFCLMVSFMDQILKGFLPGREFDRLDMVYDMIGYVTGMLIAVIVTKIIYHRNIKGARGSK